MGLAGPCGGTKSVPWPKPGRLNDNSFRDLIIHSASGPRWPAGRADHTPARGLTRTPDCHRLGVASVPVAATGAGGAAGRWRGGTGDGDFVPHPAGEVQAVALGLPGGAVGGVGVERMPVVGSLHRAAGACDGAELAG